MSYASQDALLVVRYDMGDVIGRYHNLCDCMCSAGLHRQGEIYGHRDLGLIEDAWTEEILPSDSINATGWLSCEVDGFGQRVLRHLRELPDTL